MYLKKLLGMTVVLASKDEQGIGLMFSNDAKLAIFNKATISRGETLLSPEELRNLVLEAVDTSGETIRLRFTGNASLEVDLSDKGYSTPEAMMLVCPGEPIVVWN